MSWFTSQADDLESTRIARGKEVQKDMMGGFFPVQVGPPTAYASNIKHWMHLILFLQVAALLLRAIVLLDLLGAFWMAGVCGLGWYAYYQQMNISYLSAWGLSCSINCLLDVLLFIIPAIIGVFEFELLSTCVRIFTPCVELLGALFAWHLYRDYQMSQGVKDVRDCDPLGNYFEQADPDNYAALRSINRAGTKAEQWAESRYKDKYGSTQDNSGGFFSSPFLTGPAAEPESDQPQRKQSLACC